MIEAIKLANQGAYDQLGTSLTGLKTVNFIFGPNGSGKTTISRVIEYSEPYQDCTISWASGTPLETRVYNRDFVGKHFDTAGSIKGIYTLGEGNISAVQAVTALKAKEEEISNKLRGLEKNLHGADGQSGMQKERDDLKAGFEADIWKAKGGFDQLKAAFSGVGNSKAKFAERYLDEAKNNKAELRDISNLIADARVFSNDLAPALEVKKPAHAGFAALEEASILSKKVIGKTDVDIAALIQKLGNSDWVQQGRSYFDELGDQCPFCQQGTDASFRRSLEEYFDESYVSDLAAIDSLRADYTAGSAEILDTYGESSFTDSAFLDREAFDRDIATLRLALEANGATIISKKKEPSTPVTLKDTPPLFSAVDAHIDAANAKVRANNDTFANLDARKRELIAQVWRRLLEDTKAIYDRYTAGATKLDGAITGLSAGIEARQKELQTKRDEISENERKITSIRPTIDEINKLLKSFGFANFYLIESTDDGFYEIKRPSGEDAKNSLSEGEKSFITFLYFYHHVKGSFSSSGANTNRIVVFDDPVSSLDADILFIVCNLINGIINEVRDGTSPIKQVIVLTHNIYFHKEITFDKRRSGADAMKDETFWIIRKSTSRSELVQSPENPIRSSYELLWREVRQNVPSDTATQNVMRRILEHYFKFFGGVVPEEIIEKFDGKEKIICGSLFSWINDGSHFANDDLFMSCDPGQVDRYLAVFRRIFEVSGHEGHYKMMMGDAYVALDNANDELGGSSALLA